MWDQVIQNLVVNKETVFLALFLYLLWMQQKEKKEQNQFILKQQGILYDLTESFERLAKNQERLTERIEKIEVNFEKLREKGEE